MPTATDYSQAIQNLRLTAGDDELKAGEPLADAMGLPLQYSGNFAVVFQVRCPQTQKTWAVKCFTKDVDHRAERYDAISQHLQRVKLPFMVGFQYQERGILVSGRWYPIVKMDWVEGEALNGFVAENLDKPGTLRQLLGLWLKLAERLRAAEVTHADLQHGNVLLVPAKDRGGHRLMLVDYDGMYVPALARQPSGELGHPAYQHPQRLRDGVYSAEVDRFSHLAIYCAIRCLIAGGRGLWERFDNGDNLLFRESDFAKPSESETLHRLWAVRDEDLRALVGHLIRATQTPLDQVPLLDQVVCDAHVRRLEGPTQQQVARLMANRSSAPAAAVHERPLVGEAVSSKTIDGSHPDDLPQALEEIVLAEVVDEWGAPRQGTPGRTAPRGGVRDASGFWQPPQTGTGPAFPPAPSPRNWGSGDIARSSKAAPAGSRSSLNEDQQDLTQIPSSVGVHCPCGQSISFHERHAREFVQCNQCGRVYRLPTTPGIVYAVDELCEFCQHSFSLQPGDSPVELKTGGYSHQKCLAAPRSRKSLEVIVKEILKRRLPQLGLFVAPDVPAKKSANAMTKCRVPVGEEVLGLIDCTVLGSAKNALLFGRRAAYYHNGWEGKTPGAGAVPYEAFPGRQFGLEGMWEVSLGNSQFVNTAGCSVPRKIIVEILRAIQQAVEEAASGARATAPAAPPSLDVRIVEILRSHGSETDLYVSPNMPTHKASNAANSCGLRPSDTILGLIDCTVFGSASDALVFGEHGFYYHNMGGNKPDPGFVAYREFPRIRFGTAWLNCITLGGDRYCNKAGSTISRDKIIEILDAVKRAVIESGQGATNHPHRTSEAQSSSGPYQGLIACAHCGRKHATQSRCPFCGRPSAPARRGAQRKCDARKRSSIPRKKPSMSTKPKNVTSRQISDRHAVVKGECPHCNQRVTFTRTNATFWANCPMCGGQVWVD